MLERDFEKFMSGPQVAPGERMHVTLRTKGDIFLNANTYRMLGRPDEVMLFYSRDRDTIAIAPAQGRHRRENFPVKQYQTGYRIGSSPLIRHYGLRVKQTQRFSAPEINENGYLLLDLRNTINVPTSKRKVVKK